VPAVFLKSFLELTNTKQLGAVLEYHVISGAAIYAKDLKPSQMVKAVEGDELNIAVITALKVVRVNSATLTAADNARCYQRCGSHHRRAPPSSKL
jgi:uncharacterized surface protein with fasciclin (FAS1) repeats